MTDASAMLALSTAAAPARRSISRPALAIAAAAAMAIATLLLTVPGAATPPVAQADPELTMLLRFMAGVKAMLALAALAAVAWRLGYPASPPLSAAYLLAPALMCAAPVLIWRMAHVAAGAGLFHGGLIVLLIALYADRGNTSALAKTAMLRLRRA